MTRKNIISLHEAVVLSLLNEPMRTANFKKIAQFINKRNLCPIRKGGVSLEDQVMLRTTKSKGKYSYLFEDLGAGFIRLRDTHADFPMHLYSGCQALLDYDKTFYNPNLKELRIIDKGYASKETRKVKFSPAEIVCILSMNKGRRKSIYVFEKESNSIRHFEFNNQAYTFKTLCEYLDPINGYLVNISKSSIIGVAFFDLVKKRLLKYNGVAGKTQVFATLKISDKGQGDIFLQNFITVKEAYKRRILLQKAILGYKSDIGL